MNTALFVDGSLSLGWTAVGGIGGLLPRLAIKGQLIAKGYGIGAVVSITTAVTVTDLPLGGNGHLGTTTSRPYVLNWVKQQWVQDNPPPDDETNWDLELHLPMPPGLIEAFEATRQGKEFWIQLDTTVLMIDRGVPLDDKQRTVHYQVHPTMTWQERMRVTQHDWGEVLKAWDRAAAIPLVVPLPETDPHPDRAAIVRYLRDAWRKVDGADYSGSIAEARKALETMRRLSPAWQPLPNSIRERDVDQRHHAVVDAVFSLASASAHTDDAVRDFVPSRADAVAIVAGTAAAAQRMFTRLTE